MAWLGLGKKNRFTNKVIEDMYGLFEHYGVEKDNATIRDINSKNKPGDPTATYHVALMQGFHEVIKANLDEMLSRKRKMTPRQGSLYCLSGYITNAYNAGSLEMFKEEEPDLYKALNIIWFICRHHLLNDYATYASVVIAPETTVMLFPSYPDHLEEIEYVN